MLGWCYNASTKVGFDSIYHAIIIMVTLFQITINKSTNLLGLAKFTCKYFHTISLYNYVSDVY
jgi:hypothetical protein